MARTRVLDVLIALVCLAAAGLTVRAVAKAVQESRAHLPSKEEVKQGQDMRHETALQAQEEDFVAFTLGYQLAKPYLTPEEQKSFGDEVRDHTELIENLRVKGVVFAEGGDLRSRYTLDVFHEQWFSKLLRVAKRANQEAPTPKTRAAVEVIEREFDAWRARHHREG